MIKYKFEPWIGAKYSNGVSDLKVMVIKDDYFCKSRVEFNTSFMTIQIEEFIDEYNEVKDFMEPFIRLERICTGSELDTINRIVFWNSIAVYNFIQHPLQNSSLQISQEALIHSNKRFLEILEIHQPDCLLIWGDKLYNHLSQWGFFNIKKDRKDNPSFEIWTNTNTNYKISTIMKIFKLSRDSTPKDLNAILSLQLQFPTL